MAAVRLIEENISTTPKGFSFLCGLGFAAWGLGLGLRDL